ncbi:MAG: hypothetical protein C4555_05130 [Dehalococcoidia bacterium]|nr:MAG: hypothetical protein C4555_05130 [Dehalococcoidia bacterium]
MDDKTKEVIISGAIANLPLIVATVQQLMNMAVKLGESVDMTQDQLDKAWAEARADGRMRRAADLPDAI